MVQRQSEGEKRLIVKRNQTHLTVRLASQQDVSHLSINRIKMTFLSSRLDSSIFNIRVADMILYLVYVLLDSFM